MESQCVNCTGGYYCNETGQLSPMKTKLLMGGKKGGNTMLTILWMEGNLQPKIQRESQCFSRVYHCNDTIHIPLFILNLVMLHLLLLITIKTC
jgi:hypothetical protein